MEFDFITAPRIRVGPGTIRDVGSIANKAGERPLVVTGRRTEPAVRLLSILSEHGLGASLFSVAGEPELDTVRSGVALAKAESCDFVISLGGGSAIDAGKAIAGLLTNEGDVLDYLEIIGKGKALARRGARFIAIPTTAGTGSEVTRNAVLASPEHRLKVSLRSPHLMPGVAVVDPELTYELPPDITAYTGMDALTQLIEPFVCTRANPMTDAVCREGIPRAARSLARAFRNGTDVEARLDMSVASLFGGLALANAGLGAVHGLAGPLGGMFSAPHGALCAALLPHVMEGNLRALRERLPAGDALRRYEEVARMLTGNPAATADCGVDWVRRLVSGLNIPPLRRYGITRERGPEISEKAANASSMKANPVTLTPEELGRILDRAIEPSPN